MRTARNVTRSLGRGNVSSLKWKSEPQTGDHDWTPSFEHLALRVMVEREVSLLETLILPKFRYRLCNTE